jgi:uncharacterized protein DUF4386
MTDVLTRRHTPFWPRRAARLAGFLYLLVIVGGGFAEIGVRQRLLVANDPAATASNILAHEQLFRWGFTADLFQALCIPPLILLLYVLLKGTHRYVAIVAVFFSLIGAAVQSATLLGHFAPLILLKRGAAFGVDPALLQAATYMALQLQGIGYAAGLVFFGGTMFARGYLIVRGPVVPRWIGVFLMIEGVAYWLNSTIDFVAPALASTALPILMATGLAEVALCVWLLIAGVNANKWQELRQLAEHNA